MTVTIMAAAVINYGYGSNGMAFTATPFSLFRIPGIPGIPGIQSLSGFFEIQKLRSNYYIK